MKKKLLFIIFLPVLFTSIFSCKKLIEIEETNFIDADLALTTLENNHKAIIGAYGDFGTEMGIRLNGVFSDELKPGEFYASASTHEWQYTPNDISIRDNYTATTAYYYIIYRANMVLKALPDIETATPAEEALKTQILGEALFLRAFCHFELYRYYCGNYDPAGLAMPYIEEPAESLPAEYARMDMGTYFQKLENDLAQAKSMVPDNLTDIFRANKLSVSALQARIALYKRDWPNAITYSTEYIDAIPLSPIDQFIGIWQDANSNEVSFKLKRTTSDTRVGDWYRGRFTKNSGGDTIVPASIVWVPSDKLWNSFEAANDIRFEAYLIDEPKLAAVAGKPHKIVHKYAGTGYTSTNENIADIKIFRTGEMYLIRAEARAESGTFTGANSAESDINALRTARINSYADVVFTSKEEALTAIIDERYKELAFEGHRFWDLKRRSLPIERLASDAPNPAAMTLPANHFRFLLPIPQPEMLANAAMEQNPGYAD